MQFYISVLMSVHDGLSLPVFCMCWVASNSVVVSHGRGAVVSELADGCVPSMVHRSLKCHIAICPVCAIVFKYCLHLSIKRVSSKDYRQDR